MNIRVCVCVFVDNEEAKESFEMFTDFSGSNRAASYHTLSRILLMWDWLRRDIPKQKKREKEEKPSKQTNFEQLLQVKAVK